MSARPLHLSVTERRVLVGLADGHAEARPDDGRSARVIDGLVRRGLLSCEVRLSEAGRSLIESHSMGHGSAIRLARRHQAQALRDAGVSLADIGATLGVSRERARQLTKRTRLEAGRSSSRTDLVDPLRVVAEIRSSPVTSLAMLARATGYSKDNIARCIRELDLHDAVLRLFLWRRMAPTRRRIGAVIKAEHVRLGRTPTIKELAAPLQMQTQCVGTKLVSVFGSIKRAMEYADVPPRSRSGHRAWRPGMPIAACDHLHH